jgi:ribonucleoside-diphosphate reductase alpha chain
MASHFLPLEEQDEVGIVRQETTPAAPSPTADPEPPKSEFKVVATPNKTANGISAAGRAQGAHSGQPIAFVNSGDAPACSECGAITVRSGSCYKCLNCGATTGCS